MKSIARLTGALCLVVSLAQGVHAQNPPAPRLELSQELWNFGKVWQEERPTFVLTVRNAGNADLHIKEVRTTCGCTAAQPARNVVPPGETTTINVVYDTHGKQREVSSKVLIYTDDPRMLVSDPRGRAVPGEKHFHVKGFVKRAIMRDPLGGLVIKSVDRNPGQVGTVRLTNEMPQPMKLALKSNSVKEIDIEVKEVTPGVEYVVIGRTNTHINPGTIKGEIVFTTGLQREPEFTVHARIKIYWDIEASPAAMLFRSNDSKPARRQVKLEYYGADGVNGLHVTGAKTNHPDVKVDLSSTRPPLKWMRDMKPPITAYVETWISVPAPTSLPPEGAVVTFTTTNPERPRIDLLITTNKEAFEAEMYAPPDRPAPRSP